MSQKLGFLPTVQCVCNCIATGPTERFTYFFDEFLTNDNWEKDEYRALNDFCDNFNLSYDVLAVSFLSKQVAVKLIKNNFKKNNNIDD